MTFAHLRGHLIYWDEADNCWRYDDTDELAEHDRPCIRCGRLPTPEGYDACLGFRSNVSAACCGHGVEKGYIQYETSEGSHTRGSTHGKREVGR